MTNYLLTIAINHYTHQKRLANCIKDAKDLADILIDKYSFEDENHFELYDTKATNRNIQDALRKLSKTIEPKDSLIVFFSGHGHYDEEAKTGYWIPVDGNKDYTSWISNDTIINLFNNINCCIGSN